MVQNVVKKYPTVMLMFLLFSFSEDRDLLVQNESPNPPLLLRIHQISSRGQS